MTAPGSAGADQLCAPCRTFAYLRHVPKSGHGAMGLRVSMDETL
ncbi:hypothetical protein [Devosia sp. DBB001]|nr:hypothetical protein [Devosia sp. DBB001]